LAKLGTPVILDPQALKALSANKDPRGRRANRVVMARTVKMAHLGRPATRESRGLTVGFSTKSYINQIQNK
jgi:hypothetical protein